MIKSIAITLASLLGATALAASATIVHESKQCEETMRWARRDVRQFDEDVTSLHRIWDKAVKLEAYGVFTYSKELNDARADMDESNKKAGGTMNLMRSSCIPYSPAEKLAARLNPKAWNMSHLNNLYSEVLDRHNNKDWSY
jgi:hypothetical protein